MDCSRRARPVWSLLRASSRPHREWGPTRRLGARRASHTYPRLRAEPAGRPPLPVLFARFEPESRGKLADPHDDTRREGIVGRRCPRTSSLRGRRAAHPSRRPAPPTRGAPAMERRAPGVGAARRLGAQAWVRCGWHAEHRAGGPPRLPARRVKTRAQRTPQRTASRLVMREKVVSGTRETADQYLPRAGARPRARRRAPPRDPRGRRSRPRLPDRADRRTGTRRAQRSRRPW
jgi:hypothetical protein